MNDIITNNTDNNNTDNHIDEEITSDTVIHLSNQMSIKLSQKIQ